MQKLLSLLLLLGLPLFLMGANTPPPGNNNQTIGNINGKYGVIAPGSIAQAVQTGVPSNQWTGINIFGDASSWNSQFQPLYNGWGGLVAKQMGVGPTYGPLTTDSFSIFDCDVVDAAIAPISPAAHAINNVINAWLPSPADPTFGGGFYASHLADTQTCWLGGLTWLSVPQENKTYARALSNVTTTGAWTPSSSYGGVYGYTTDENGDALTFTTTTTGGPLYLWYQMAGNNGGAFTWTLDSTTTGSVTTEGNNAFTFPITGKTTLGAIRIPATSGGHSLAIAVSSTTTISNTVTIEGLGTSPQQAYSPKSPAVVMGGELPNTAFPAAGQAFNTAIFSLTAQLQGDGLRVPFANVQNYWNPLTDTTTLSGSSHITNSGQTHIAQAFNGIIQPVRNSDNAINPIDFGASANSLYFTNAYCGTCDALSTTANSNVISIANYTFQPGNATQFGGGDVGKVLCIGPGSGGAYWEGPCTYIKSVNTANNTATIPRNAIYSASNHYAVMCGYPSNPNDPSTATTDTHYVEAAGQAAILNGGRVFLPTHTCLSNLVMPQNIEVYGNSPGDFYLQSNQDVGLNPQATVIDCAMDGGPDDVQQCIQTIPHTRFHNFMMRAPTFPYTPYGLSAACLGYSTSGTGPAAQVLTDHLSYFGCPVDFGQAYGYNHPVSFLATVTSNMDGVTSTMNVLSITTSNFAQADLWMSGADFLAVNRLFPEAQFTASVSGSSLSVTATSSGIIAPGLTLLSGFGTLPGGTLITAYGTGTGGTGTYTLSNSKTVGSQTMTAGPTITAVPPGGTVGSYTISAPLSISTSTAYTSNYNGQGIELRDNHSQHIVGGIGYNGDFSDSEIVDSFCTGTFMSSCWRLGPYVTGFGNGANRWIGGRMEEVNDGIGVIVCDGCGLILTGVDFEFNTAHNITTLRSTGQNSNVQVTGGEMIGGGSGYSATQDKSMIELGGSGVTVDVSGVALVADGANSLFSTATGATSIYASVEGGSTRFSGNTLANMFDWANGIPSGYKQDIFGFPRIDTSLTVTATSTGFTIGSLSGGAAFSTTSATSTSATGTITLALPGSGLTAAPYGTGWNCSGGDQTAHTSFSLGATTSTSAILYATSTVTSGDALYIACPNGL